MATARGKTSPDVALLVRRVQMDERFKVDDKRSNNKINITGPEGQPLIISQDADTSDVRRAERQLERMGLRQADQPAPKTRQRVTTTPLIDPYPNITVYEKARKVHKNATDYAKAKQVAIGLYDGVEFYVIDEYPLKYFIGKSYPKIKHYSGPGGTQEIYDFLRSTGNYAREKQDDDTSAIIVRVEFSESGAPIQWRSPRGPVSDWQREQARKEAKLTPHEAGEDREPAPVVTYTPLPIVIGSHVRRLPSRKRETDSIYQVTRMSRDVIVILGISGPDQGVEHTIKGAKAMADGFEVVRFDIAKHAEAVEPTPEPTPEPVVEEPTPEPVPVPASEPEIEEVEQAFEMLKEALSRATGGLDHTVCEEGLAEARQEAQFQRADAQVQRERAQRAEETLNLIWLAFSTMAQHKAVAEILPLLPPLKDF